MKLNKEMENELYSFIVDTNQEHILINSIKGNDKLKEDLEKYFEVEE